MKNVLFYISGHGYGHSVRTIEVVRVLCQGRDDVSIKIKTVAPKWLFNDLVLEKKVEVLEANLDAGVVEVNPLLIDTEKTVEKLSDFIKHSIHIFAKELAYGFQNNIDLIVSDVPALAGEIAAKMNVPCLAASNFLWDWIYEPLIDDEEFRNSILTPIRTGYSKMICWMRYPFYHNSSMISKIIDVSLVVRKVEHSPEELQKELNLDMNRRKVYIAFRDGLEQEIFITAAKKSPDCLFLIADEPRVQLPSNVKYIQPFPKFSFVDVINMCDVVVGKPGYGLASNCVACKKRLLYSPRSGFREDDVLMKEVEQFIPTVEIPTQDFLYGNWNEYLVDLTQKEMPKNVIKTDGAQECYDIINSYL